MVPRSVRIGIDASNLRQGGGRTHLVELMRHGDGNLGAVTEIVVWGSADTLSRLPQRPWLTPAHEPMLDGNLVMRLLWQGTRLVALSRKVDLVFAPGGVTSPLVRPRVVMSRNLLPFEPDRVALYPAAQRLRLELLRGGQARSFATADGMIFLNEYARNHVSPSMPRQPRRVAVIPHGVAERFRMKVRPARDPAEMTVAAPLRVLYVSSVTPYKHQLEVIAAMRYLNADVPAELTLVGFDDGSAYSAAVARAAMPDGLAGDKVRFLGQIGFDELHHAYAAAEVFVFASSCENMPNILLEAMSNSLPIACARRGPMPEILGDAGVYFDPESPEDIAAAVRTLACDPALRVSLAERAEERSRPFSWVRCARETFGFLAEVARAAPRS
jgi:glycosyltransferase involved in cell wall biosynthesis